MRYQFQSEQGNIAFKPQYFTDAIKVLIIANVAMFLFRYLALSQFDLAEIFGLSPGDGHSFGSLLPICSFMVIFFTFL